MSWTPEMGTPAQERSVDYVVKLAGEMRTSGLAEGCDLALLLSRDIAPGALVLRGLGVVRPNGSSSATPALVVIPRPFQQAN